MNDENRLGRQRVSLPGLLVSKSELSWVCLAQDKKCCDLVNTVIQFRVKYGDLLGTSAEFSFKVRVSLVS